MKPIVGFAGLGIMGSAMSANLMAKRAYRRATMKVEVWQKDMRIIGDFVRRLGSPAPLFLATKAIYDAATRLGYGKADTASVCAVLERRSA